PLARPVLPVLLSSLFNTTPTSEIYSLSLHDALPICARLRFGPGRRWCPLRFDPRPDFFPIQGRDQSSPTPGSGGRRRRRRVGEGDRKSTRLNSSHVAISYAVFCLKKKTQSR